MTTEAQITITNNHGSKSMVQYRTASVMFDHKALVDDERSRADALDIWVDYRGSNAVRLPAYVQKANTTDTIVFFQLQAAIAPGGGTDTNYWLRWGNLTQPYFAKTHRYSQFQAWLGLDEFVPAAHRFQPFMIYDDYKWVWDDSSGAHIRASGLPDANVYDYLGIWTSISNEADAYLQQTWATNKRAYVREPGTIWDRSLRVRCECWAQAGATDPSMGVMVFGQDHGSDLEGYSLGLLGDYSTLGLYARDPSGGDILLDSNPTGAAQSNRIFRLVLAAEDTGSAINLEGFLDGVSLVTFSDPTRKFNVGMPGVWVDAVA